MALANLAGASSTIPSGKVVRASLPAGSLLNAAMYSAMQQVNISSSTSYAAAWTIDYTPVSSNSVLYFYISTPSLGEAQAIGWI